MVSVSEHSEFLIFQRPTLIAGLLYTTNNEHSISEAFVPVIGTKNGRDVDYDSKKGFIYWIEYDSNTKNVCIHHQRPMAN